MQQKVVKVSTRMNSCPLCSAKLVKKYNKKAPFGCKSIVARAKHWMVPIS